MGAKYVLMFEDEIFLGSINKAKWNIYSTALQDLTFYTISFLKNIRNQHDTEKATKPFYGIRPVIVNKDGKVLKGEAEGRLCIAQSWPGQMRTVYGDHQRMIDTYFSMYEDIYFTGDGARRDEDGYYWITGRVDDVLNVSGHRLGTAEIESALVLHPKVAEAAVVGFDHPIKGQGIYAFVTLMIEESFSDDLNNELKQFVAK